MIRVGVIGAGSHSTRAHGPALVHCRDERPDEIELRAVCDLDRDRAHRYADQFGFESAFETVERMLASEPLDAVVAVTPVAVTREVVADLFTRDVPVLVEKPPGRTVEEARELEELANEHGSLHAVSFNRRFNPAVRRAREWLARNVADRPPMHVISRLLRTARFEDEFITETGIHVVDTVCSFLGRPSKLSTRRWRSPAGHSISGPRCASLVTYGDATAQVTIAPDAGTHTETTLLVGPGYTVRIDVAAARLSISMDGEVIER